MGPTLFLKLKTWWMEENGDLTNPSPSMTFPGFLADASIDIVGGRAGAPAARG